MGDWYKFEELRRRFDDNWYDGPLSGMAVLPTGVSVWFRCVVDDIENVSSLTMNGRLRQHSALAGLRVFELVALSDEEAERLLGYAASFAAEVNGTHVYGEDGCPVGGVKKPDAGMDYSWYDRHKDVPPAPTEPVIAHAYRLWAS